MKKCLILGGNGFLGSHLAKALLESGNDVTVFGRFKHGISNLESIKNDIHLAEGDFSCENDLRGVTKDMDYVFQYISTTTPATAVRDPVYDVESNVVNTLRLLNSAVENNVQKIIFPSSGGTIYGEPQHTPCQETDSAEPLNPYSISKLTIEKYLHYYYLKYNIEYLILRYSNPYGPGQNPRGMQGVIPVFLNRILSNEQPIIYGDGSSIRDYIYVDDAIDATLALLKHKNRHPLYNIGSGVGVSLNDLIVIMSEVTGRVFSPKYVPDNIGYISKIVLDVCRLQEETGWMPEVGLKEGIGRTWAWLNYH